MKLYILRHAEAADRDPKKFPEDALRPRLKKGKKNTLKVARTLKKDNSKIDLILSSSSLRALDGARIIRKALKLKKDKLVEVDALLPEGNNSTLIAEIKEKYKVDSLLLVGHNPNLTLLISQLLAGSPDLPIRLRKGGLCKLSIDELTDGKCAVLEFLTEPSIVD